MRTLKIILAVLVIQLAVSCNSKSQPKPTLVGKWKITSAVGNDSRHWTGSFTLKANDTAYTGLFIWDAVDGKSAGTDSIAGNYNFQTRVLTMRSVVISGNIESVLYATTVAANGKTMQGIWTGSSDGTVADPGVWAAIKE